MEEIHELFTDGGVIGRNPSTLGGTIAWCLTERGERVKDFCRTVTPGELQTDVVTNNNTELLALMEGIDALPEGWNGRVNSDSRLALNWVFSGWSQELIPTLLRERLNVLRNSGRLLGLRWRLLQGHPTDEDLEAGIGKKRNLPVSEHNQWCDLACQREAEIAKAAGGLG